MNPRENLSSSSHGTPVKGWPTRRQLPVSLHVLILACAAASGLLNTHAAPPVVAVSGTAPVLLSWPTNFPGFGLLTKTNLSPTVAWEHCPLQPVIIGTNYVVTNTFTEPLRLFRLSNWPQLSCLNNLRQIGVGMRVWAMDNDGRFPFHTPASWGGSMELRAIGPDGFDTNTWVHFMVMSNYLSAASLLVCPGDLVRKAATNFESLGPENVTYRLRTGDTVKLDRPEEVLAVCPIDGNTLYCDGSTTAGINY